MTTTDPPATGITLSPANRVLVIGTLDTIRDRGKQVISREQRNDRRGRMDRLALQVRSPYGGTFLLPLDVDPSIRGGEILVSAKEGTPLALEGEIQLVKRFDRRFSEGIEDEGREVREMHLHVMAMRKPEQTEMYGTSAVWLEGVIAEPPRFLRHPELPDILLASTVLDVTLDRPSPIPHSRAITVERMRVRVAVPVDHQHAPLLYRPGNKVTLEGQVDCIMEAQGGAAVDEQVEKLRADWQARQEELAAASEQDRRTAERTYRRARAAFLEAPRVQVLVGFVELRDGSPATMAEARDLRREHLARVRERRASGRLARARATGVGRGPQPRAEGEQELAAPPVIDPPIAEDVGLAQPVRARQRRDRRATAPVAETPAAVEVAASVMDPAEAVAPATDDAPAESVTALAVVVPAEVDPVLNGYLEG